MMNICEKLCSYFKFTRFWTLNYRYKFYQNHFLKRKEKDFIKPYKYLSKYLYAIDNIPENNDNSECSMPIWQCWFQGEENMPNSIKLCLQSIKEFNPDREIILITEKNMNEYIKLPDFIIEKYKKGIISRTHFSDILRLYLLKEYGGVWVVVKHHL